MKAIMLLCYRALALEADSKSLRIKLEMAEAQKASLTWEVTHWQVRTVAAEARADRAEAALRRLQELKARE